METSKEAPAVYSSQAHIATDRASRYLTQLGKHTGQMGRLTFHRTLRHGHGGAPPEVAHSEWSDTDGVITFGQGRCTLHAAEDALTLYAEAEDPEQLRRIQDGIARRLERISRRDQLTVTWSPTAFDDAAHEPGKTSKDAPTPPCRPPNRRLGMPLR